MRSEEEVRKQLKKVREKEEVVQDKFMTYNLVTEINTLRWVLEE